jgi:hypothetical protein
VAGLLARKGNEFAVRNYTPEPKDRDRIVGLLLDDFSVAAVKLIRRKSGLTAKEAVAWLKANREKFVMQAAFRRAHQSPQWRAQFVAMQCRGDIDVLLPESGGGEAA